MFIGSGRAFCVCGTVCYSFRRLIYTTPPLTSHLSSAVAERLFCTCFSTMRTLPFTLILLFFTLSLVSAVPLPGINPSKLAEDLAAAKRPVPIHKQGFKSFFANIRSKFLGTKTSKKWIHTFTTEAPSHPSRSAASRFVIPPEDAMIAYRQYTTPRASADTVGAIPDEIKRKGLGLWTKARQTQESWEATRGTRGRMSADSLSPRLRRPTGAISPRVQRGRELEIMPGSSPRLRKPEIEEIRKTTGGGSVDSPSMRKVRFADEEFKYPILRDGRQVGKGDAKSESDRGIRYPVGWKPATPL